MAQSQYIHTHVRCVNASEFSAVESKKNSSNQLVIKLHGSENCYDLKPDNKRFGIRYPVQYFNEARTRSASVQQRS